MTRCYGGRPSGVHRYRTGVTSPEPIAAALPERVLVIMAHPDDVDFSAAGSIAQWTAAGSRVSYCIITDGDAGGFDPSVPRSEIGAIRRSEQAAAAARIGVTDLVFLGYPDGLLQPSLELRRDIVTG